ncbi:MAG: iron-sulfur cluster co-chaperone HscB C-terminal domain-containing protein [Planctomycetota bacterium]
MKCSQCSAELETPLACAACGALFVSEDGASPFAIFGLAPAQRIDEKDLRKRLSRFTRLCHPDFYSAGEKAELRELAERNTAALNAAHQLLSEPTRRADWLVSTHLRGPDEQTERQMPQAFLLEVLEWNEQLEEARDQGTDPSALGVELQRQREEALSELESVLDPLPAEGSDALPAARRLLNGLRYLDRALGEIEALRLARAAARS